MSIDESTKRAFGTLALKFFMTGGVREFFMQKRAPLREWSSIRDCNQLQDYIQNEANDIKLYGTIRSVASYNFSAEEMTQFLEETSNADPTEIYTDRKNPWRPFLILQILSDVLTNEYSPAIHLMQTYCITPYSFWTRIHRLVRIPDLKLTPSTEDRYPVIVPLLDSIFVQCHGIGGPLVRVKDLESAVLFLFCVVALHHGFKLHNGTEIRPLIESCVDLKQELPVVQKILDQIKSVV
jgi:hypothetical protein